MAAILRELWNQYLYLTCEIQHPHSKDLLFMNNPLHGLSIILLYLFFVLKLGPKLMENREPFKLVRVLQIYNLAQIISSAYIFINMFRYGWGNNYSFRCQPSDSSDDYDAVMMSRTLHTYFLVKVVDLLDTVFFVLRKKDNQISFLHVYHHAGMVALSWGGTFWFGNGHCTMIPFINCFVHVVMYFYYFLTSLDDGNRKYMWWKKHITQLQIGQFLYLTCHFAQLLFSNPCGFPKAGLSIVLPQNSFMLMLFIDFYIKAYIKKRK